MLNSSRILICTLKGLSGRKIIRDINYKNNLAFTKLISSVDAVKLGNYHFLKCYCSQSSQSSQSTDLEKIQTMIKEEMKNMEVSSFPHIMNSKDLQLIELPFLQESLKNQEMVISPEENTVTAAMICEEKLHEEFNKMGDLQNIDINEINKQNVKFVPVVTYKKKDNLAEQVSASSEDPEEKQPLLSQEQDEAECEKITETLVNMAKDEDKSKLDKNMFLFSFPSNVMSSIEDVPISSTSIQVKLDVAQLKDFLQKALDSDNPKEDITFKFQAEIDGLLMVAAEDLTQKNIDLLKSCDFNNFIGQAAKVLAEAISDGNCNVAGNFA